MNTLKKQGLDAPIVPLLYIIAGLVATSCAVIFRNNYSGYLWTLLYGIIMVLGGLIFIHTSIRGKHIIWDNILSTLTIPNDSKVLDLGTGHGLVLLKFASRLSENGHATGIDLWRNQDQSNNSIENTQNIIKSYHLDKVASVQTANMLDLPFKNNQYDFVVTSLALHNIKPATARKAALNEATRVLKSAGTLVIVDTGHKKKEYLSILQSNGFMIQEQKTYGIIGWWSGPWMSTYAIIATAPTKHPLNKR